MVLDISGFYLFTAMAAMWLGICGGLVVMLEYKDRRRASAICFCAFTAIFAASVWLSGHVSLSWFNVWRHASTALVPLVLLPFVSDGLPAFIFTIFSHANACTLIVAALSFIALNTPNPPLAVAAGSVLLNALLLFIYAKYLRGPYRQFISVCCRSWNISMLMPVGFAFAMLSTLVLSERVTYSDMWRAHAVVAGVFTAMALSYATVLRSQRQQMELSAARESESLLQARIRHQRNELEMFTEAGERNKRLRHDLHHHAQILLRFISDGETKRAADYIAALLAEANVGKTEVYCSNYTVNSVLSIFADRAQTRGIDISVEASVPALLNVDDMELAAIYANALDNAIEGCMRYDGGHRPKMEVRTLYSAEDSRLILQVRNTCEPGAVTFDVDGVPLTQKEDGGVGISSIRYIVEKHNGTWHFAEKDGVFSASIAICNM